MLCGGARSPGVPSRGRMETGEEENLCRTATPRRRTSQTTAPRRWEITLHMVNRTIVEQLVLPGLFSLPDPNPHFAFYPSNPSVLRVSGLKQLLDAQQLCDVTLLVEGKKFMCHRYDSFMKSRFSAMQRGFQLAAARTVIPFTDVVFVWLS